MNQARVDSEREEEHIHEHEHRHGSEIPALPARKIVDGQPARTKEADEGREDPRIEMRDVVSGVRDEMRDPVLVRVEAFLAALPATLAVERRSAIRTDFI